MASAMLERLHAIEETVSPWELANYIKVANAQQLNGIHHPFWQDWPLSEPSTFFIPEVLHHLHKMFHSCRLCHRYS